MSSLITWATVLSFFLSLWMAVPAFPNSKQVNLGEVTKSVSEKELAKRLIFYKSISTLKVNFKQRKILKGLNVEIPSEGSLKLKGHEQVIWEIINPSLVRITFNRASIKVESGEGAGYSVETWKIEDMPKGKESKNIAALEAWLQLDAKELSEEYYVTTQGRNTLKFVSKAPNSSTFLSVEMKLASSGHLENLRIAEASGDEINISFDAPTVTY